MFPVYLEGVKNINAIDSGKKTSKSIVVLLIYSLVV